MNPSMFDTQTLSLWGNHWPLGYMEKDNKAKCLHSRTGYFLSLNNHKGKDGIQRAGTVKVIYVVNIHLSFR